MRLFNVNIKGKDKTKAPDVEVEPALPPVDKEKLYQDALDKTYRAAIKEDIERQVLCWLVGEEGAEFCISTDRYNDVSEVPVEVKHFYDHYSQFYVGPKLYHIIDRLVEELDV